MLENPEEFSPTLVRAELERILASSDFAATERIRRFLIYVVEEALAGRADRIKAYTIATSVFGRGESFDPQVDSIVRIEAGRLRRTLERYYLTAGQNDELQLRIPKGSYAPVLIKVERGSEPETPGVAPAAKGGPVILVERFEQEGDPEVMPNFAAGMTRALIVRLTRFTSMNVYAAALPPSTTDQAAIRPDYILSGSAGVSADRLDVEAILTKACTGQTVWADSYQTSASASEFFSLKDEIANRVAQAIAQPYGVIFADKVKDSDSQPPSQLNSYSCVLNFHSYWKTFDRHLIEPVRQGLERTIQVDPHYAEAFACLSLTYSNAHRFRQKIGYVDGSALEKAVELANRAIDLAPSSSWSHYARSLAYWFSNDVPNSIKSLDAARKLNPNDTTIMAELGQRHAFLMDWEKAVPLLEEAYAHNPALPGAYHIGMFLYHLAHERFDKALHEASRIYTPDLLYGHVAIAVAAGELGHRDEAVRAVRSIVAIDPRYGDYVVADLQSRNLHEDLIHRVLRGLQKAGLTGRNLTNCMARKAGTDARRRGA